MVSDREVVIVGGAQLGVELGGVEVEQEVQRRRQHDQVAEGDAGEEQRGHCEHEQRGQAALPPRQRRSEKGVRLVQQHGQGEQQRGVGGELQRRHERLAGAECDRLHVARKGRVDDPDHQPVLPGGESERHEEGRARDHQSRAQLVQVVDDRQPLPVPEGLDASHRGSPGLRTSGARPAPRR
jgi:hypothetical protein